MAGNWTPIVAALVAALLTSAAQADTEQFHRPRAEILQEVRVMAVLPVDVDRVVPDRDAVARRYEQEIVARLRAAGFQVVEPDAMRSIRQRLTHQMGGLYDPMTGQRVEDKVKALKLSEEREFGATHTIDAYLRAGIVVRQALTEYGSAVWGGVRQKVDNGLKSHVRVLSLEVRLESRDGTALYEASGGLQALRYVKAVSMMDGRIHDVDPKFVLTDPKRDERAVTFALDPLVAPPKKRPAAVELPPDPTLPAPERDQGLHVNRPELLEKFGSVAIAPLGPDEFRDGAAVARRYRQLIATKLAEIGFRIVGGDELEEEWERERAAAGGFYDPFTGERDEARWAAARDRVLQAFGRRHTFDAMVYPSIVRKDISHGLSSRWDGVEQSIMNRSDASLGLVSLLTSSPVLNTEGGWPGELKALSLSLRIQDREGNPLYGCSGGIQTLQWAESPGKYQDLPESDLFSVPEKDERAVNAALKELAMTPVPKRDLVNKSKAMRDRLDPTKACDRLVSGLDVVQLPR